MIISDLSYLDVVSEDQEIVGGLVINRSIAAIQTNVSQLVQNARGFGAANAAAVSQTNNNGIRNGNS